MNPKHSSIVATMKKINPAKTSIASKSVSGRNILVFLAANSPRGGRQVGEVAPPAWLSSLAIGAALEGKTRRGYQIPFSTQGIGAQLMSNLGNSPPSLLTGRVHPLPFSALEGGVFPPVLGPGLSQRSGSAGDLGNILTPLFRRGGISPSRSPVSHFCAHG